MVDGNGKGQAYMREISRTLSIWSGWSLRPRPTIVEPSEGWQVKGDLQVPDAARFPFCVECKKVEGWSLDGLFESPKWAVWQWWEQCVRQAKTTENTRALLIFSRNRRKNYVLASEATLQWLKLRPVHGPLLLVRSPKEEALGACLLDDLVRCRYPKS